MFVSKPLVVATLIFTTTRYKTVKATKYFTERIKFFISILKFKLHKSLLYSLGNTLH